MDAKFYVLMHVFGLASVLLAIAGLAYREAVGGPGQPEEKRFRSIALAEHGFGLLLMVVSGFGLLAKQGIPGVPGWAWAKIVLWLYLAVAPVLVRRFFRGQQALVVWLSLPLIVLAARWLAIAKPF